MASWHLFNQDWFTGWAIRKMGGFSVHREGDDRRSLNTAIDILATASRPLVIFPEGSTSHSNDRLHPMLDGVAILARAGAKKRMKNQKQQGSTNGAGKVVVHPIALKYRLQEDLFAVVDPVLREIEQQFTWRPQDNLSLLERIEKLAEAQLCLKEIEYFGEVQRGDLRRRIDQLIERLLIPVEQEWLDAAQTGKGVAGRVKALRMKIVPEMVDGVLSQKERNRRWRQLADLYLAQQISCYLPNYLRERPSVDRLLETVERFDEDLNDYARVMGRRKVIIEVGEAIEVSPRRDRHAPVDPLMEQIRSRLQSMLDKLALESPLWEDRRQGKDLAPRPKLSPPPQQPETRTEFARE